ncbi:hypothetical protein [Stakelama flava]|nr:hypothetical protein [Stakelama flava]
MPAIGQDKPESLLPPGFGDAPTPSPTPRPRPAQPAAPTPAPAPTAAPQPAPGRAPGDLLPPGEGVQPEPTPSATPTPISADELLKYELPAYARRPLSRAGFLSARNGGLPATAYGGNDGRYIEALMRRIDTPLASRWLSIGLRRTLASQTAVPSNVNGADFAAERAWLLVRMGEAFAARAVVQSVDTDNYTPKLYQVAMQAHLAMADPAGLCPLVGTAQTVSDEPSWKLAAAMCAGLAGKPDEAGKMIDSLRRRGGNNIDILLAEKVLGEGAQGRRAVTIEWDGVDRLTAWRYGLATATGADVPDRLLRDAQPQVRFWRVQAPMVSPADRLPYIDEAAARGVLSSASLVDLYGQIDEEGEASTADRAVAHDLREAYSAATVDDRLTALQRLWDGPEGPLGRYARLVLTARASAGIPASGPNAAKADRLIASMLSAGLDEAAMRWMPNVARGSNAWAMLALADPSPSRMFNDSDVDAYRVRGAEGDSRKAQMLVAGLAGLGRLSDGDARSSAQAVGLALQPQNRWAEAIDAAGQRGDPGMVMVLAGIGMQTPYWQGVPPEALFHIVAAMRASGLDGYARMIAAEAIARL